MVLFTAMIAIVVLKERLSATGWVGLGVGIFGIFLITITVTSMIYVEPVVAIIVAWFWLKELPSGLSMLGGIIAILSVLIVNGVGRKRGLKEIVPL